jgi:hypothetical protein
VFPNPFARPATEAWHAIPFTLPRLFLTTGGGTFALNASGIDLVGKLAGQEWWIEAKIPCATACLREDGTTAEFLVMLMEGRVGDLLPMLVQWTEVPSGRTAELRALSRSNMGAFSPTVPSLPGPATTHANPCGFLPCETERTPAWLRFEAAVAELQKQGDWTSWKGANATAPFLLSVGLVGSYPLYFVQWDLAFIRLPDGEIQFFTLRSNPAPAYPLVATPTYLGRGVSDQIGPGYLPGEGRSVPADQLHAAALEVAAVGGPFWRVQLLYPDARSERDLAHQVQAFLSPCSGSFRTVDLSASSGLIHRLEFGEEGANPPGPCPPSLPTSTPPTRR